jgi:hypothetical protein
MFAAFEVSHADNGVNISESKENREATQNRKPNPISRGCVWYELVSLISLRRRQNREVVGFTNLLRAEEAFLRRGFVLNIVANRNHLR